MLESDQQWVVDLFVLGVIDVEQFEDMMKMWSNFYMDYFLVVNFVVLYQILVVVMNILWRYVFMVFKKGVVSFDMFFVVVRQWMVLFLFEVDIFLLQYWELVKMGLEMYVSGLNFVMVQVIKDVIMVYFILWNWKFGMYFFYLNGVYYSDYY